MRCNKTFSSFLPHPPPPAWPLLLSQRLSPPHPPPPPLPWHHMVPVGCMLQKLSWKKFIYLYIHFLIKFAMTVWITRYDSWRLNWCGVVMKLCGLWVWHFHTPSNNDWNVSLHWWFIQIQPRHSNCRSYPRTAFSLSFQSLAWMPKLSHPSKMDSSLTDIFSFL